MTRSGHYKWVSLAEFGKIKALLQAKVPKSVICKTMERSDGTIDRIQKAESFPEFQKLTHETYLFYKKQNAQKESIGMEPQKSPSEPEKVEAPAVVPSDIVAILAEINQTLKRLADAWESHPNNSLKMKWTPPAPPTEAELNGREPLPF